MTPVHNLGAILCHCRVCRGHATYARCHGHFKLFCITLTTSSTRFLHVIRAVSTLLDMRSHPSDIPTLKLLVFAMDAGGNVVLTCVLVVDVGSLFFSFLARIP